jgi:hydroxymethylpyrimidine/phosphomethylpyrimidine kinase
VSKQKQIPVALTIAGSDSGGGAGIQADLKTFAALGVHGTSAITCVTAQNPRRVLGIQACQPAIVRQQIEAVFEELPPSAVKTGMLYSTEIIRVVVEFFKLADAAGRASSRADSTAPKRKSDGSSAASPHRIHKLPPLVVDPVMISTSGAKLLKDSAVNLLKKELLPLAALVTPNVDEAEFLLDRNLKTIEDLRTAAKEIHERFGCAALVKGGHLRNSKAAADIFYDGNNELLLTAPFVKGVSTHGTGCTYAAAITAYLALGHILPVAVELAKEHITQAIARHQIVAGHAVLNNFWR